MNILMSLLLFCSSMAPTEAPTGLIQAGKASFYAKKFTGRRTTSGERVDPAIFSAAHLTLPFNTLVEVTNVSNNRSVIVRINDRGPHIRGRIIDLTYAPAKALGIISRGVATVTLRVIGKKGRLVAAVPSVTNVAADPAQLLPALGPVD